MTKRVLFCILLALGDVRTAQADQSAVPCSNALNACIAVIKAQDTQVANLKAENSKLASALADATRPPLLPTWAIITISVLTGAAAVAIIKK